jgi:16S rRNA (cytidine1402-2'-O)-methyltransferase
MPGTIYLVATPIGNLEDITLRALRILKEADLIACEDTRQTRKLLEHFQIRKPLISYHEHNEAARAAELVEKAFAGATIAVVSDAGMPGISDPGFRLVQRAIEQGITVTPIPGAVAAEAALAASGLPTDSFRFCGFLPPRHGERRRLLESLAGETATLIFYEAPHRIIATLEDVGEVLGSRPVVVARELTKVHEEFVRGSVRDVLENLRSRPSLKGEITLLVARAPAGAPRSAAAIPPIAERVQQLMREQNLDRMTALKKTARERGISKREAYRLFQERETGPEETESWS